MRHWLGNSLRGLCMGTADVIPGVSGGTVALILGIYPRLIDAVAGIGPRLLRRLGARSFWRLLGAGTSDPAALPESREGRDAGRVLLLGFLGAGILPAIAVGASVLPPLLGLYPAHMRGLFLGLVLASATVPLRALERRGPSRWLLALGAAAAAAWFAGLAAVGGGRAQGVVSLEFEAPLAAEVRLTPRNLTLEVPGEGAHGAVAFGPAGSTTIAAGSAAAEIAVVARMVGSAGNAPAGSMRLVEGPVAIASVSHSDALAGGRNPGLPYLFVGGVLAISAMALPGVSGAFVLLLLGLYQYVLHTLALAVYQREAQALVVVGTLVTAFTAGLLTIVRVLKWLFARWRDGTLAVLVGLMLGSLRKLWPFTAYSAEGREVVALPALDDPQTGVVALLFGVGVGAVLLLNAAGRRRPGRPGRRSSSTSG